MMNGHNFTRGFRWSWPRPYHLAWWRIRWLRATRWFRPQMIVVAVDPDRGIVTVGRKRWSWRRWRWERVG